MLSKKTMILPMLTTFEWQSLYSKLFAEDCRDYMILLLLFIYKYREGKITKLLRIVASISSQNSGLQWSETVF